eukprot:scaffold370_cov176-Amphora_coffeaeformis.AAC.1
MHAGVRDCRVVDLGATPSCFVLRTFALFGSRGLSNDQQHKKGRNQQLTKHGLMIDRYQLLLWQRQATNFVVDGRQTSNVATVFFACWRVVPLVIRHCAVPTPDVLSQE